jgi:hypothetical protein
MLVVQRILGDIEFLRYMPTSRLNRMAALLEWGYSRSTSPVIKLQAGIRDATLAQVAAEVD